MLCTETAEAIRMDVVSVYNHTRGGVVEVAEVHDVVEEVADEGSGGKAG